MSLVNTADLESTGNSFVTALHGMGAVSYTHLDVYKRQLLAPLLQEGADGKAFPERPAYDMQHFHPKLQAGYHHFAAHPEQLSKRILQV